MEDEYIEGLLIGIFYHLIFETEDRLNSYQGHSEKEWEAFMKSGGSGVVAELLDALDWACERPNYDFRALIRPEYGLTSSTIYKYICLFRDSARKYL